MRQALYHHKGISEPVTEIIPEWNNKTRRVHWISQKVTPSPDYKYYLEDPNLAIQELGKVTSMNYPKLHELAIKFIAYDLASTFSGKTLLSHIF